MTPIDGIKSSFKIHVQTESVERIVKCLDLLTEEQVWERFNDNTSSIGNLILHLCGNVRQWIIATLGSQPDLRDRDAEFAERGPISKADLMARLRNTITEAVSVVEGLDEAVFTSEHEVQCYRETGTYIVLHVSEHFSYHTGQIVLATKIRKGINLDFYAGQNLSQTTQ